MFPHVYSWRIRRRPKSARDDAPPTLNADGSAMIASAACGPINTDYTFQGAKYSYGDTDDNCNMGGDALIYKMNAAGTPV